MPILKFKHFYNKKRSTQSSIRHFVESYGYKDNDACSNGISALNLILLHRPEIAILDINMPGLDGLDLKSNTSYIYMKY